MLSIPCLPADLLKYINLAYAKNYKIIPLKYEKEILTIAMAEPDPVVLDEVVSIYKNSSLCIEDVKIVITSAKILDSIDMFCLK